MRESGRRNRAVLSSVAMASLAVGWVGIARADQAKVLRVVAHCNADSICRFDVTIRHADTGWKHYADRFEILDENGKLLATKVLRHPHVHEQPFTRSLAGVEIDPELVAVYVRARDKVDGYSALSEKVELVRASSQKPKAP